MANEAVVDTGVLKNPELDKLVENLKKEEGEILKKSSDLRQSRETLLKQIQPLEAKLREIDKKIIAIERPRRAEIAQQLGMLAKAMGGKSMGINSAQQ